MNPAYKILGALLLAIGLFSGGYYAHKPEVVTKTKVEIQEKVVERRNVVTKTVVASGKATTTTVDRSVVSNQTAATTATASTVTTGGSEVWRPSYRLGVLINPAREYTGQVGYRLFGGLWAIGQYQFTHRDLTIGISIDF